MSGRLFSGNRRGWLIVTASLFIGGLLAFVQTARTQLIQDKCPVSQGYWKNHPANWPVNLLVLGDPAKVAHTYSKSALLGLLNSPTKGDASLILANQLIAAKLNIASGSNAAPVAATVGNADALLGTFSGKLPYGVKTNTPNGQAMTAAGKVLEDYNAGLLPNSCASQNTPPVANAGPDQTVFVGDTVTLNGGASYDADGDPLTFNWSFVSRPTGSSAALSDPVAVSPTFLVDRPGSYTVRLFVNDGKIDSSVDVVIVSTFNSRPVANAGPDQTTFVGNTVTLDGSASSDFDGDPLTFSWSFVSRPAGSSAALNNSNGVTPIFVADRIGDYVVQLIVNDGLADSLPDTVRVSTQNTPPVANAGANQTGLVGDTIVLDGSGSTDVDGNPLTYSWSFVSRPAGSKAALQNPTSVTPSFDIDAFGNYVIQLIVNDGTVNSTPSTVTISTLNSPPVANAGPDQAVFVGDTVQLDGSGSTDVDGNTLTFAWSIVSKPQRSLAALSSGSIVNPTFVVDLPGTYVIQLIVNDGTVNSAPDTVSVSTQNRPPVANAGPDQSVTLNSTVQLNGGSSSDPDGDNLTYSWSLLSKPSGSTATLSNSTLVNPTFIADLAGTYVAQLIVNDGTVNSAPDTVTISTDNSIPVADAGTDQTVAAGSTVQLDGGLSYDPDGTSLFYFWSLTTRPTGSSAALSDSSIVNPTFVADRSGTYVAQLMVGDGLLVSAPDTVVITSENQPPQVNAGPDQTITLPATATLSGTVNDDGFPIPPGSTTATWSQFSGPGTVTFGNANALNTTASFSQAGVYVLRLTGNDGVLSASDDVQITVNAAANQDPVTNNDSGTTPPGTALQINVLANDLDPDGDALTVTSFTQGANGTVVCLANGDCTYTPNPGFVGQDSFTYTASDGKGGQKTGTVNVNVTAADTTVNAPPVDGTVATTLGKATEFLYTGTNPVQTGVAPGTIQPRRAAVIRGKVMTRDGNVLPGVTVRILNRPEFGQTTTRSNGYFDMAVNGGGPLTVDYQKNGFLPAQRQLNVPWQDYALAPDVIMIAPDNQVTVIALNASTLQVARGSTSTDSDGARRATLLIPPGTQAQIFRPDGTLQPVSSLSLRLSEYTIGPSGPNAMPAPLPPTSAYTYAVELGADEAVTKVGGKDVLLSQPVFFYLENFLNFPVGGGVPSGYYDQDRGQWVPSENGRVVKIVGVTAGFADVDTVGTGALAPIVLSDAERQQLAALYSIGQTLWRVPVSHFSTWDYNWPYVPPPDSTPPNQPSPSTPAKPAKPCREKSSVIECHNQTLGKELFVVGTQSSLHYRSDRIPDRRADFTLTIPLSGASVPASLKRIELSVQVAGQALQQSFNSSPNQRTQFTWDGLDVYGRRLQGSQPITGSIAYVYDAVYAGPPEQYIASFARLGSAPIVGNQARGEFTIPQPFQTTIGGFDARAVGLGGWTHGRHHSYDPFGRVLHLGNGERRELDSLGRVIRTFAGPGNFGVIGDGGPATEASLFGPGGVATAPDGSVYIADTGNQRVRRVAPDGIITTVAGNGVVGFSGDGGPATQAELNSPFGVALGGDGSLYIADTLNHVIRRVDAAGIITTVAGNGVEGLAGDGGPATQASLAFPWGVAVSLDGSLYIVDPVNHVIRRVDADGIITTVAGTGAFGFIGDGGPSTQASLARPSGVAVGPDGSFYIADSSNNRIRRVGPDGIIATVAGNGAFDFSGDGGPATQASLANPSGVVVGHDGEFYIADNRRIRRVNSEGIITTVAGSSAFLGEIGDGGPATQAILLFASGVALGPDGGLYIADSNSNRVRFVAPMFPGFTDDAIAVASEDGGEFYVFDAVGRHLRTHNTLTGAVLHEFTYDPAGRLAGIVEKTGGTDNVTIVERDGGGSPTAFIAPFGQRTSLALNANGFLASISNPAGEQSQLDYTPGGLLTTYTDPMTNVSRYSYDAAGWLVRAEDPVGGFKTLARTENANGHSVTLTTALGRTTTYQVENLPDGTVRQINSDENGARTIVETHIDGKQTLTYPDGVRVDSTRGPDPRFGMQVPRLSNRVRTLPGGQTETTVGQFSASLANPDDPFSLQTLTETFTVNNRTFTRAYDGATRTLTSTSAEGRQVVSVLDALGRVIQQVLATGTTPVTATYDARGRVSEIRQGNQLWTFGYDALGRVVSRTDAASRVMSFSYDGNDRLTQTTFPSGAAYGFDYDANGNRTQVILPSGARHVLAYTPVNRDASYTPPGNASYLRSYNVDGQLTRAALPGGRVTDVSYEPGGRVSELSYAEAVTAMDYFPNDPTDRVARINHTPNAGPTQDLVYTYNGSLINGVTASGATPANITYSYDDNFLVTGMSLTTGGDVLQTALGWDRDGLLSVYGPFALTRDGPGGALSEITDGSSNTSTSYSYDNLVRLSTRSHQVSGQSVYALQLTYDNIGRITGKTETVSGTVAAYTYAYDLDNQLTEVRRNGGVIEQYTYDINGNRSTRQLAGGPVETARYDGQDRLLQRGATVYQFNEDGFLTQRGADTFQYSARGQLLQATVSGQPTSYAYDGLGRRVSRTDGGGTTQYLYGDPSSHLVTAVRGPAGTLTALYYDTDGLLIALERSGERYYVATDQVGTPRIVSNSAGAVVRVLEYDSFGNLIADSNAAFDLFIGYAGGLADVATGLVHFANRDYEPASGRWTARDPVLFEGGQGNLYAYVGNDPIHNRDPLGLFCISISLYEGVGGGVQTCFTKDGLSVCGEIGFGVGGGAGVSTGGLAETGVKVGAEVKLKCGNLGAGLETSYDDRGCGKLALVGEIGPLKLTTDDTVDAKAKTKITAKPPQIPLPGECGLGAKAFSKACVQGKF